jgi:hypothetical protein
MAKKLTSKKAKEILHDKSVHGHPLTDKQRRFFGAIAGGAPIKAQDGIEKSQVMDILSNLPIYSPDARYSEYRTNVEDWRNNLNNVTIQDNPNLSDFTGFKTAGSYFDNSGVSPLKTFPYSGTVQLDPSQFNRVDTRDRVLRHELTHGAFDGSSFIPMWYADNLYNTARNPGEFNSGAHENLMTERAAQAMGVRGDIIRKYGLKSDAKIPRDLYNSYLRDHMNTDLRTNTRTESGELRESLFGAKNATDLYNLLNMENIPKQKNGGWLDKYATGGETTTSNSTTAYPNKPYYANGKWNIPSGYKPKTTASKNEFKNTYTSDKKSSSKNTNKKTEWVNTYAKNLPETKESTVDPKLTEAYLKLIGYDPNRKWISSSDFTPSLTNSNESVSTGVTPRRDFDKEEQGRQYFLQKQYDQFMQDQLNKQTYIGPPKYNDEFYQRMKDEADRKIAQGQSDLSRTMGSMSGVHNFEDYTASGGVGTIGAKTQLAATALPVILAGIGMGGNAILPYLPAALDAAIAGVPGLTANNLAVTYGGYNLANNIANGTIADRYRNANSFGDYTGATLETGLDVLGGYPFASTVVNETKPFIKQAGNFVQNLTSPSISLESQISKPISEIIPTIESTSPSAEITQDLNEFIGHRPTNIPSTFNSLEEFDDWYSRTFPRMGNNSESLADEALRNVNGITIENLLADVRNGTITHEQAANKIHNALRTHTNDFQIWDTRPIRMSGLVYGEDDAGNYISNIIRNRSGFTTEEAEKIIKDKGDLAKLSSNDFSNTVIKPTGEVGDYAADIRDKLVYNPDIRKTQAVGTVPLSTDEYIDQFNSRLDLLNDIIEQNNTSGVPYRVTGLDKYGLLRFDGPTGKSSFSVDINPGQWRGEIEDIANEEYYKSIPGLDMRSSSPSVFGDFTPRRGSRAYESINEYLKKLDLGRVKSGFNTQSPSSRPLWENAIKQGKAYGFYKNPSTINGILRTLIPAVGAGAVADAIFGSDNNPKEKKKKKGGSVYSGEAGYTDIPFNYNSAWGGQFQNGGLMPSFSNSRLTFLEPNSYKLPTNNHRSELAVSIGGEDGEPAFLVPSFKYGQPILVPSNSPDIEFRRTGDYLGGPFKTWQEADEWDKNIRHPYVEKGQSIPTPLRTWGKDFAMGGSLPGSVGFTYARTSGSAPSNGPYAKKTKASAQDGAAIDPLIPIEEGRQELMDFYNKRPSNLHGKEIANAIKDIKVNKAKPKVLKREDITAYYTPATNKFSYDPNVKEGEFNRKLIAEHEFGHGAYKNLSKKEKDIVSSSIVGSDEFINRNKGMDDLIAREKRNKYFTDPSEVYTRRNLLFDAFGLDPSSSITKDQAQQMIDFRKYMDPNLSKDEYIKMSEDNPRLFEMYEKINKNPEFENILNFLQSMKDDPNAYMGIFNDVTAVPGQQAPVAQNGTILTKAEEEKYQAWRSKLPKNLQWEGDYDLKGLWKSNPKVKPSPNLHFPDTYKLPNHPTFSNESNYYDSYTPGVGGYWGPGEENFIKNPPIGPPVPHAENGMTYYQHGLDWKPKTISKNGSKTSEKPYKFGKSGIEGKGTFAKKDIKPGEYVGKVHTINQLFTDYDFTDLGRNHNHSDNPNVQNVLIGNERHLVAIKPIKKGTELTSNYRLQPDLEQPEDFEKKGWLDKYK